MHYEYEDIHLLMPTTIIHHSYHDNNYYYKYHSFISIFIHIFTFMAATLISDSNSAPDNPTVRLASFLISTSSARRAFLVFFSKISSRALRSGREAMNNYKINKNKQNSLVRWRIHVESYFVFLSQIGLHEPVQDPIPFSSWSQL